MKSRFFYTLLIPLLAACARDVDLAVGDRQVAIECILTDESTQTLRLALTTGVSGIESDAFGNAIAKLTDLTESRTAGIFERIEPEVWTLDYAAIPGHSYRLEVEVPGYGIAKAEDTMPAEMDVLYLNIWNKVIQPIPDSSYFFRRMQYPDGSGSGLDYIEGPFFETSSLPDHLLIKGYVFDTRSSKHKVINKICTDCPGVDNRNVTGQSYESETVVYDNAHSWSSDHPTWRQVLRLNPNLDGCTYHSNYLKIEKDKALSQAFFQVSGDFSDYKYEYWNPWGWSVGSPSLIDVSAFPSWAIFYTPMSLNASQSNNNYLLFMSISDHFNSYLDDAMLIKNKDDLTSIFMRTSAHSNVEGGVGILGCAVTQRLPVSNQPRNWDIIDIESDTL